MSDRVTDRHDWPYNPDLERERDAALARAENAEAALTLEKAKVLHLKWAVENNVSPSDLLHVLRVCAYRDRLDPVHERLYADKWAQWEAKFTAQFQQAAPEPPADVLAQLIRDGDDLRRRVTELERTGAWTSEQVEAIAREVVAGALANIVHTTLNDYPYHRYRSAELIPQWVYACKRAIERLREGAEQKESGGSGE